MKYRAQIICNKCKKHLGYMTVSEEMDSEEDVCISEIIDRRGLNQGYEPITIKLYCDECTHEIEGEKK